MSARRARGRDAGPDLFGHPDAGPPPPFETRIVAGLDEAGLGPLLGPLSIGVSAFRVAGPQRDLWAALEPAIAREVERDGQRLVVADSKAVFVRTPRGAERLESTVLAFEAARRGRPTACADTRAFLEATPEPLRAADLAREPWYGLLPARLAGERAEAVLDARIAGLAVALAAARVEVVELAVRAVPARELNASFSVTASKGETHWRACLPFLRHVWDSFGMEGVDLVVDRHGGRMRYGALLRAAFARAHVAVVRELPAISEYTLRGDCGRALRVTFAEKAENLSFAVALASCAAKYAREACMQAFNAYFGALQQDLEPTAGYVTDARRWLAAAAVAIERSGIARDDLVRSR